MKPVSELLKTREGTLWHVRPDEIVFAALELLAHYEVGALMVMDQGLLVGVFSERDYTRKVALLFEAIGQHQAGQGEWGI